MFFGSAINNFGVQEILQALVDWAPPPQPRNGGARVVEPAEAPFTGFVFKIQANMDPRHRDRIAFFRVCSGRYAPGMKVRHLREGREMKLGHALTFMANERVHSEDAVAGDILGIHNHGQLQIGDTLTEGEVLAYKGIPYFAPELFRVARPRDPFKAKQLAKGLQELGEEGAIQVFESTSGNAMMLGAVGPLQFEIVAHRLATEYKVDALYDNANIATARWLTFPDETTRRNFEREQAASLATDVDGNPVFLATNKYNLQVTMERWPKVGFRATREHGEKIEAARRGRPLNRLERRRATGPRAAPPRATSRRHPHELRREQQPRRGVPEQVEDVERTGQRPGGEHLQLLPDVRLGNERRETQRQRRDDQHDERYAVEPLHRRLPAAREPGQPRGGGGVLAGG